MLLGYGLEQPSYRHRMRSLIDPLQAAGWQVRAEQFPSGRYGLRTWERRALLRWADVTVLHQIKLSSIEARLICRLQPPARIRCGRCHLRAQAAAARGSSRMNPPGASKNLPPPAAGSTRSPPAMTSWRVSRAPLPRRLWYSPHRSIRRATSPPSPVPPSRPPSRGSAVPKI